MLPKNLANRITLLVLVILFIFVILLISGANWITKSFYQNHLEHEVEGRVTAHANLLKTDADQTIIEYIDELETDKKSHLMLLNDDLTLNYASESIPDERINQYVNWINDHFEERNFENEPFIDRVESSIFFHIPHIRAITPISRDDQEIIGYVFLDQDTGEFNYARIKLLLLLVLMGGITFGVGVAFTNYLSKRISDPLNHISETTKKIADGDFDIHLNISGEDEVAHLATSIQSMTNQLKEYRESRRHFISNISHDLRTPITYIKGYSAVMKETPEIDEAEIKRNLEVIYQEANRIEQLVSDLFLLTKLEQGKIKLNQEKVPICAWLTDLYQTRVLMFDQKSIKHQLRLPEEDCRELYVNLDAYRMEQALINMIENAIRYTPNGGEINLSLKKKKDEVILSVQDTGSGISEKDLPYIWERFYKADQARKQEDSGTGLGLAIVQEIVEAHGGTVDVKSTLGVGTTFFIHIPLHQNNYL